MTKTDQKAVIWIVYRREVWGMTRLGIVRAKTLKGAVNEANRKPRFRGWTNIKTAGEGEG